MYSTVKQSFNNLFYTNLFTLISGQSCLTGQSIENKLSVRNPGFRVNSFKVTNAFELKLPGEKR